MKAAKQYEEERLTKQDEVDSASGYMSRLWPFLSDLLVVAIFLAIVRPFVKYVILWGASSELLSRYLTPHVVERLIWPCFFLIVGFLLRDVIMRTLYQLPGFVKRSVYGQIVPTEKKSDSPSPEDPLDEKVAGDSMEKHVPARKPEKNENLARITPREGALYESIVLRQIERDYGCTMTQPGRVRGSSCVFDGVFEQGGEIYAVKIKCGFNRQVLSHALCQIRRALEELPRKTRNLVNVIFCVISNRNDDGWKDEVREMVSESGLNVSVRLFKTKELQEGKE